MRDIRALSPSFKVFTNYYITDARESSEICNNVIGVHKAAHNMPHRG